MLNSALQLAELGYRVFPCQAGAKTPLTPHGCLDATTDAAIIEQWWQQWPDANIGMATDGLIVIDVDGPKNTWLKGEPEKLMDLVGGKVSLTANLGRHYIFRQPAEKQWRNSVGKIASGVDTRAGGGYIVVPPSRLEGDKRYQWAPGCELDCKPESLAEPPKWLADNLDEIGQQADRRAAERGESEPAKAISEGGRNATLTSLAGTMRRVGMTEPEILAALKKANIDRCKPPLTDDEVSKIAWSVARYEPDALAVSAVDEDDEFVDDSPADPGIFPQELLYVPGFINEVMEYNLAGAFKRQPELALGAALPLLGTLTGRKIADAFGTRTNLYTIGAAESGAGKERARKVNKEILNAAGLDKMLGGESFASHAGLVNAVERQPAIFFQVDEVGRLLKTLSNPGSSPHLFHVVTVLLKLYSSSDSVYLSDVYADTERNKTINQPHACVYGTAIPQTIFEGITADNITDGFLSRLLIFEATNHKPKSQVPVIVPVPHTIIDTARYWGDYRPGGNLSDQNPTPTIVTYSAESQRLLGEFNETVEVWAEADKSSTAAIWVRTVEKARKLALLYACSAYHKNPIVDRAAATWGIAVSEYLTRKMVYFAWKWTSENKQEAVNKRVLRLIESAGARGMTGKELCRKTRWLSSRERVEVLAELRQGGFVFGREMLTGGRPSTVYIASNTL